MDAVNAANLSLLLQNASVVPMYRLYCCGLRLEIYLDLYRELTHFERTHQRGTNPEKPIDQHAEELMNRFFPEIPVRKLDISEEMIQSTRKAISENISATVFQPIQQKCFGILEQRTLSSFISSPCYLEFLQGEKEARQASPEKPPEIEISWDKIKAYQNSITNITAALSKLIESQNVTFRNQQNLINVINQSSDTLTPADSTLVQLLKTVAETMEQTRVLQEQMNHCIANQVQLPLNNILKQEIVASQNQKRKHEGKGAKSNANEPAGAETANQLFQCAEKCEQTLLQSFCTILEENYNQYETVHATYNRLLPTMIKYRTEAELKALKGEGQKYQIGSRMDVPEREIIKSGQMEKKGAIRRNWTSRWFILKSRYLFYFNNKNDLLLKGYIHLKNCTVQVSSNKKKPNCLEVCTSLRTFFISAPSENDCKEWVNAIRGATVEEELKRLEQTHKEQLESLTHSQAEEYLNNFLRDDTPKKKPANEPQKTSQDELQKPKENPSGTPEAANRREQLLAKVASEGEEINSDLDKTAAGTKKRKKKSEKPKERKKRERKAKTPETGEKKKRKKKKEPREGEETPEVLDNSEARSAELEEEEEQTNVDLKDIPQPSEDPPVPPIQVTENNSGEEKPPQSGEESSGDGDEYDESDGDYEDDGLDALTPATKRVRKSTALGLLNSMITQDSEEEEVKFPENSGADTLNDDEVKEPESLGETEAESSMQESSINISSDILYKQGYLLKKGAKRRNWTTRWFILGYNHLAYYKNPGDSEPKGSLELKGTHVEKTTEMKKPCCFCVVTPLRTYFFSAKNNEVMEEWIACIRKATPEK